MSSHSPEQIKQAVLDGVQVVCKKHDIAEPAQIQRYANAVCDAVLRHRVAIEKGVIPYQIILQDETDLLDKSIQTLPERMADYRAASRSNERSHSASSIARNKPENTAKSIDVKLAESRTPLQKLVRQDCVRLSLVSPEKAEQMVIQMTGKTREQAEADIMQELRNNLHKQVQLYIRKHKGGPWASMKLQEGLRLDITKTHSVQDVLLLTRKLLKEREHWEASNTKGLWGTLVGGIKLSRNKK